MLQISLPLLPLTIHRRLLLLFYADSLVAHISFFDGFIVI